MKKSSIIFLQAVITALGIGVLVFMLWEPHFEGRNVNATVFQIYFNDPFLAYVYASSIAFFTALYQALRFLGFIGQDKVFTLDSVKALRIIKYCAMSLVGFILGAEAYFFIQRSKDDDIAGGVVIGLVMIFLSAIVAVVSALFERILQSAVDRFAEKGSV